MAKADKSGKIMNLWSKYGLQLGLLAVLGVAALSFIALGLVKLATPSTRLLPMVATKVSQPIQAAPDQPAADLPKPLPPLIQPAPADEGPKTETGDQGQVRVRGQVTRPDAVPTGSETPAQPTETGTPPKDATAPAADGTSAAPNQDTSPTAAAPASESKDTSPTAAAPATEAKDTSPPAATPATEAKDKAPASATPPESGQTAPAPDTAQAAPGQAPSQASGQAPSQAPSQATSPAQDQTPTAPASQETAAAPAAPARLKPATSQTAADETKPAPAAAPDAQTAPAQETPPAAAAAEPTTAPQAAPSVPAATGAPQAPPLDQPAASMPLEATVATTAPSGTGSKDATTEIVGDRLKLPKPRWQTVNENWDKAKLAEMGPETLDTGDSAWKQLDVGETDQVTDEGQTGEDIPMAPLMTAKTDQTEPEATTPGTKSTATTKTGTKASGQKSKSTSTKTASRATKATASTRTSSKSGHGKTARTGSASTPTRSDVTLSIINETGRPGQGNVYRDVLQAMGYQVKSVVDRPPQSGTTTILYNTSSKDKATALARRIPGQRTVAPQQAPYSQDIVIVVR